MNKRPIAALAICHKDVEQAKLWLKWVFWLSRNLARGDRHLVVFSSRRAAIHLQFLNDIANQLDARKAWNVEFAIAPDECEDGYPKSASHLFLRLLEHCETNYPGRPVLFCEPDTVAIRPAWFDEIAEEYIGCGKPNMGQRIWHQGGKTSHCTGNSVYPANWRDVNPSIATVLSAPDHPIWGPKKSQPWDIWAADETAANMHETALIQQIFTCPPWTVDNLSRLLPATALFHRAKDATLICELVRDRFPEFAHNLRQPDTTYQLNGHPNRLRIFGYDIGDWKAVRRPAGWLATGRARTALEQLILDCLVGSKGVSRAAG